jgi:hypothetical protein
MYVEHGLLCAAALDVSVFYCESNHFLMQWEVFIFQSLCQCYHVCVNDICQCSVQLCNEVGICYDPFRHW